MKVLTLWQPWATLMAIGKKRNDTRSWSTKYRGPVAIHAARYTMEEELIACNSFYRNALEHLITPQTPGLRQGAILCIVNLIDVVPTVTFTPETLTPEEKEFGDYSPGRFAWITEMLVVLDEPIPCCGHQGLWTPGPALEEQLRGLLTAA